MCYLLPWEPAVAGFQLQLCAGMRELHERHVRDSLQELTILREGDLRLFLKNFLKKEINLSEGHGLGVNGFGGKGLVSFVIVELIRVFVRVHCS